MSRVDYSKWNNIEISDDEDDTHPNIDTPSLFKWRHEARVQRMEEAKKKREELTVEKAKHIAEKKAFDIQREKGENVSGKEAEWAKADAEIKAKESELQKEERLTPWNVDTLSQKGFTKTVINTKPKPGKKEISDDERAENLQKFTRENEKLIKGFGLLKKFSDSRKYLLEHTQLACDETTSYLTIWCVNLALEEKIDLMNHVSHQCIAMQFMLELAKQLDRDPRSVISDFFSKIGHAEQVEYKRAFEEELSSFRTRILRRAEEKIAEAAEEERQKRLGPGGLDPFDVFETLPEELKKCFESQNIGLLQETIATMPPEQATYHMKRCVESGLWVPGKGDDSKNPTEVDEGDLSEQHEAPDASETKDSSPKENTTAT